MSGIKKGWTVAASIGAVEAMKDQLGFARWNYALRCINRHAKANLRSYYHATENLRSCSSAAMTREKQREERAKKVMFYNGWGPSTIRF